MRVVRFIYSSLLRLSWLFIKLAALFNDKLKLFVKGRKNSFLTLENSITKEDKVIWMHVASLGEFEQGLPLLEALKAKHSNHKIVLTFFSPSGYEVKKIRQPLIPWCTFPWTPLPMSNAF